MPARIAKLADAARVYLVIKYQCQVFSSKTLDTGPGWEYGIDMKRNEINARLAKLTHGNLSLSAFLGAAVAIGDAQLTAALEGIWTGREGRVNIEYDAQHSLIVSWYNEKVEVAYVS